MRICIINDEDHQLKFKGYSRDNKDLSFPLEYWTAEYIICLILSWPALSCLQHQSLDKKNSYLMEICIETLQRISCSRLTPWEGQLQSKLVACWVPCRRSAPTQGLLEPVDWCLEISPGKNLMPWWLLTQIHIHSWSSGRTNLKFLLLCLDLVCLFAK